MKPVVITADCAGVSSAYTPQKHGAKGVLLEIGAIAGARSLKQLATASARRKRPHGLARSHVKVSRFQSYDSTLCLRKKRLALSQTSPVMMAKTKGD